MDPITAGMGSSPHRKRRVQRKDGWDGFIGSMVIAGGCVHAPECVCAAMRPFVL